MKKLISILLASVLMIAILCGCDADTAALTIEDHEWTFTVMQDGSGDIIACSADKQEQNKDAIIAEFTVETNDDTLILSDAATDESFNFEYTLEIENSDSTIYSISNTDNDAHGMATVGITDYDDGGSEYTLIISLSGYSIYFVETIE